MKVSNRIAAPIHVKVFISFVAEDARKKKKKKKKKKRKRQKAIRKRKRKRNFQGLSRT
jgi:hypothetical protein